MLKLQKKNGGLLKIRRNTLENQDQSYERLLNNKIVKKQKNHLGINFGEVEEEHDTEKGRVAERKTQDVVVRNIKQKGNKYFNNKYI